MTLWTRASSGLAGDASLSPTRLDGEHAACVDVSALLAHELEVVLRGHSPLLHELLLQRIQLLRDLLMPSTGVLSSMHASPEAVNKCTFEGGLVELNGHPNPQLPPLDVLQGSGFSPRGKARRTPIPCGGATICFTLWLPFVHTACLAKQIVHFFSPCIRYFVQRMMYPFWQLAWALLIESSLSTLPPHSLTGTVPRMTDLFQRPNISSDWHCM